MSKKFRIPPASGRRSAGLAFSLGKASLPSPFTQRDFKIPGGPVGLKDYNPLGVSPLTSQFEPSGGEPIKQHHSMAGMKT